MALDKDIVDKIKHNIVSNEGHQVSPFFISPNTDFSPQTLQHVQEWITQIQNKLITFCTHRSYYFKFGSNVSVSLMDGTRYLCKDLDNLLNETTLGQISKSSQLISTLFPVRKHYNILRKLNCKQDLFFKKH